MIQEVKNKKTKVLSPGHLSCRSQDDANDRSGYAGCSSLVCHDGEI